MAEAPSGHPSHAETNVVVYLNAEEGIPVPFLAFNEDDLGFYAKQGKVDVKRDCSIILGCKGSLYMYSDYVKGNEITEPLTLEIGQLLLFVPAVSRSLWQNSMVHYNETYRRASSKSSSSSGSSTSSLAISIGSLSEMPGLLTKLDDMSCALDENQMKMSKTARQQELRSILDEMDSGCCRITNHKSIFCDAAHLVKASIPDIVPVHFLLPAILCILRSNPSSAPLPALTILVLPYYLILFSTTNKDIKLVAKNQDAFESLQELNIILPDHQQTPFDPNSSFTISRNPAQMAPLQVFWDWHTATRLLAVYGTKEALHLSKQCVLVKVVEEWKQKVVASKASRRVAPDDPKVGKSELLES